MAHEGINYAAMLADLKAKRSALDASIAALEGALASGVLGQPGEYSPASAEQGSSFGMSPVELPVGAFLGKSIPAAIKLYLSAMRRKQTTAEIANALKDGGVESTSKNFDLVVKSALNGLKAKGEVLRFKEGWALAEHYSESLRKRLADGVKPIPKKKPTKAKKKGKQPLKGKEPEASHPNPAPAPAKEKGEQAMIEAYFSGNAGQDFSIKEVASALNLRGGTAVLLCSRLAHAGILERTPERKFRTAKVQQMPKAV